MKRCQRSSLRISGAAACMQKNLRGCSLQDLQFLVDLEFHAADLRMFDFSHGQLHPVQSDVVPWPVQWLAVRFHRRHIFQRRTLPDVDVLRREVCQVVQKLKWRWIHRSSENVVDVLSLLRVRGLRTPACDRVVAPELQAWCSGFQRTLVSGARSAASRARCDRSWGNMSQLTRWAFKLLKERGLRLLPYDKEDGMCIIRVDELAEMHRHVLGSKDYEDVLFPDLEVDRMRAEYGNLVMSITKGSPVGVRRALCRSFHEEGAAHSAKLVLLVKSHKTPVQLRNVHAAPLSAFASLSQWVRRTLDEALAVFPHFLRDTADLVERLKTQTAAEQSTMVRIDVKHFFMSGSPFLLATAAVKVISDPILREHLFRAIHWLLSNQYVESGVDRSLIKRVCVGSGMGLIHSSAVADAALLTLGELWLLHHTVLKRFQFRAYFRFRDDIFAITDKPHEIKLWFKWLCGRCSSIFDLELVSSSNISVEMLAVEVRQQLGRYTTVPKVKPARAPLSFESGHPVSVHRSWPVSTLAFYRRLCTREDDFINYAERYIRRFTDAYFPGHTIQKLRTAVITSPDSRDQKTANVFWVVLPYHPSLHEGIFGRRFQMFLNDPCWKSALSCAWGPEAVVPSFRLAWTCSKTRFLHEASRP